MKVAISIIILVGTSLTQTQPPTRKRARDPDLNPQPNDIVQHAKLPKRRDPKIELGYHNLHFRLKSKQRPTLQPSQKPATLQPRKYQYTNVTVLRLSVRKCYQKLFDPS